MRNIVNIAGQRNGMLVAVELMPDRAWNKHAMWRCVCDCGKELIVRGSRFAVGTHTSCGCNRGWHNRTHGQGFKRTRTYCIWKNMRQRCLNPNNPAYHHYGGRGIKICSQWLKSFESFYSDMGDPPTEQHEVDRINNDGNYCKENCRWATRSQQMSNTRRVKYITFSGRTQTLPEWAMEIGVTPGCIRRRLREGWTLERALAPKAH